MVQGEPKLDDDDEEGRRAQASAAATTAGAGTTEPRTSLVACWGCGSQLGVWKCDAVDSLAWRRSASLLRG